MLLPLWDSVIVLCFVVRYFVFILVLQSRKKLAGCFALFVFLVSRDCCVALPRSKLELEINIWAPPRY